MPSAPCRPLCGDGLLAGGEACDDGNTTSGDGCSRSCHDECDEGGDGGAAGAAGAGARCVAHCGNGVVEADEDCDDGSAANDGRYGGCNPDCTHGPFCGDGVVTPHIEPQTGVPFEECDYGYELNGVSYDAEQVAACAAGCRFANFCGDGLGRRVRGRAV